MTSYSKPDSTTAITSTDTLNEAIGKLEKALDGKGTSNFTGYTSSNKLSTDYINNKVGWTTNAGTVTSVKVGATSYSPASGVVSLPAYPTSLPASDVSSWAKATSKPTYTASEVGLGNVGNFKAVSTVASQGLTTTEKSNARANIGAGTSSFSGSYTDLTNKPTIPTVNNAKLTLNVGGATVTGNDAFTANDSTDTTYDVPTATPSVFGVVKTSTGITNSSGTISVAYGTAAGTACQGNDSRLSNARTPTSHAHGNITNSGTITSTAVTSATGVLVYDSSNKIQRATAANARAIIGAGTSSLTLAGSGSASTAARSDHTHSNYLANTDTEDFSIAITQGGSGGTPLAANSYYTITAGGASVVFKTPDDTKVTQNYCAENKNYPLLLCAVDGITSTASRGANTVGLNAQLYANPFTGHLVAKSFQAMSDRRLKENIKEFKPQKSILELPVVEFDFKTSGVHQIGCIAQDLQEICPEIVHEDAEGYLGIQESKIVYLLLDEVKKLKAEVESLKREN